MAKKYQCLLWDLDNTLLDFTKAAKLSFIDMMKQYGLPYDDAHHALYQEINHSLWNTLEGGGITQGEIKTKRWEMYFERISTYRDPADTNRLFFDGLANNPVEIEGARSLLIDLKEDNFDLCLITNGIGEIQRKRLKNSGFDHFFSHLVISDEIGVAKPNSAYFDHTFDQLSHPPKSDTLVIGDTLGSDIKGGNQYGLDTCWYNAAKKAPFGGIEATHAIHKLDEIKVLLH